MSSQFEFRCRFQAIRERLRWLYLSKLYAFFTFSLFLLPLLLCLFFMFTRLFYLWLFFWAFDYTCSLSFFCLYDVVVIYFASFSTHIFMAAIQLHLKANVFILCVCVHFSPIAVLWTLFKATRRNICTEFTLLFVIFLLYILSWHFNRATSHQNCTFFRQMQYKTDTNFFFHGVSFIPTEVGLLTKCIFTELCETDF